MEEVSAALELIEVVDRAAGRDGHADNLPPALSALAGAVGEECGAFSSVVERLVVLVGALGDVAVDLPHPGYGIGS